MRHNQNRRSRGRNNRKGPNPLTRSFESNGPDVKVRGTAAHIAEKYLTLARDAQSAGDIVAVESYLQHAEHYNRIVMAAQAQFQQSQPQYRDGPEEGYDDDRQMNGRTRDRLDYNGDGRGGEEGEERAEGQESEGEDRGYRPRPPRMDDQDRNRSPRDEQDRQRGPRDDQERMRGPREDRVQFRDRQERNDRDDRSNDRDGQPRRYERDDRGDQPPRSENGGQQQPEQAAAFEDPSAAPRRRRGRPRGEGSGTGENGNASGEPDVTPDGAAALAAFRSES